MHKAAGISQHLDELRVSTRATAGISTACKGLDRTWNSGLPCSFELATGPHAAPRIHSIRPTATADGTSIYSSKGLCSHSSGDTHSQEKHLQQQQSPAHNRAIPTADSAFNTFETYVRPVSEQRWIWVDAICIDQVHIAEVKLQVQDMDAIYNLGPPQPFTGMQDKPHGSGPTTILQSVTRVALPTMNHSSFAADSLRCSIADCAVWSIWRLREARLREASQRNDSHANSKIVVESINTSMLEEQCRAESAESVQGCSDSDAQLVLRALYLVAISFRHLQAEELFDAITISDEAPQMPISTPHLCSINSADDLLRLCSKVLQVCQNGEVVFVKPAMPEFLLRQPLHESKTGHETMARLCLQHLRRLGMHLIIRPWSGILSTLSSFAKHPFFQYVLKFWQKHYRIAERLPNDLPAQLFQLIETAVVNHLPEEQFLSIEKRRVALDTGAKLSQFYDFPILHELCGQMGADSQRDNLFWLSKPLSDHGVLQASRLEHCVEDSVCFPEKASAEPHMRDVEVVEHHGNVMFAGAQRGSAPSTLARSAENMSIFSDGETEFDLSETTSIADDLEDLAIHDSHLDGTDWIPRPSSTAATLEKAICMDRYSEPLYYYEDFQDFPDWHWVDGVGRRSV